MNTYVNPLAGIAATIGLFAGSALADSADDPYAEIAELRAELAEVKAQMNSDWMTEQRAEEIRGLVQDVLADADTRASLLQSNITAGYDGGFFLGSTDGNFSMKINGQLQFRYVFNYLSTESGSGTDSTRSGFEVRRAKIKFKGNVVDPSWKYQLNLAYAFEVGDGEADLFGPVTVEDAVITKDFGNGWQLRFGQYKGPFMREELVSSSRQQFIDRSLVNEKFNQDRSQGIEVDYKAEQWRFAALFSDGRKRRHGPTLAYDTEYSFMGRVEWMPAGEWKQFKSLSSKPGQETGFLLGGAFLWENQEYGTAAPDPKTELWQVTVDGSLNGDGWNVFAYFVYEDNDSGNPWGFVVQGGFYLNEEWELAARYEYGDSDISGEKELSALTLAANWYMNSKVKWQNDIGFGLNTVGSTWDKESVGWREDDPGKDGQVVFRSQLQLVF